MKLANEVAKVEERVEELLAERNEILGDYWNLKSLIKNMTIKLRERLVITSYSAAEDAGVHVCRGCSEWWMSDSTPRHTSWCILGQAEKEVVRFKEAENGD